MPGRRPTIKHHKFVLKRPADEETQIFHLILRLTILVFPNLGSISDPLSPTPTTAHPKSLSKKKKQAVQSDHDLLEFVIRTPKELF